MADQSSKDAAMKERIIKHMNGDHSESISLYLRHYSHLSVGASRNAVLTDINLSSMTFRTADNKTHSISLDPPMTSFADARQRTVDMDRAARSALNISSIKITEYYPPRSPVHIFVFGACIFTMVIFVTRNRIVEGTWFYDTVLPWFPGGPEFFLLTAKTIALPVVGLHALEATIFEKTRLQKYGVERWSGLWFKWVASCACEGFGCFQRIDAAVKRKEKEAEKESH